MGLKDNLSGKADYYNVNLEIIKNKLILPYIIRLRLKKLRSKTGKIKNFFLCYAGNYF